MKPRDMYAHLGGQRYFLVLFTLCLSTFLLWHHRLSSADYGLIVIGTVGAYIAGRTFQKTKAGEIE